MRRLLVAVCASAVAVAGATAATTRPLVVTGNTKIDTYRVQANGKLSGALRAFGKPTSRTRHAQHGMCVVRWKRIGLQIDFYNLGGKNPCLGPTGNFGAATLTGTRWRTSAGLRIGAPLSAVQARHPSAREAAGERGAGWWWLMERTGDLGSSGLEAKMVSGRVKAFRVTYQAGGE